MADDAFNAEHFGIAERFVVVSSVGGPFDDDAYVAGVEYGRIDRTLQDGDVVLHEDVVRTANVSQLDLCAMRHGYTMRSRAWDEAPDEWTIVAFERVHDDVETAR